MKSVLVRELMVPIEDYATVKQDANLNEAVLALEKAQQTVDLHKHKHRAILVLDGRQRVVGKITMMQVLKALEPKYAKLAAKGVLTRSGYSPRMIEDMLKDNALWNEPMEFICDRAARQPVDSFMEVLTADAYIDQDATLDAAVHKMILLDYQSLIVTHEDQVVGILRLSDLFTVICERVKLCEI
jgi:CBS domain-containing protein